MTTTQIRKWDGPAPSARATGTKTQDPDNVPEDGEWYVLRTDTAVLSDEDEARKLKSRMASARQSIKGRQNKEGAWEGFEAALVVTEDSDEDEITVTLVGRWTN